MFQKPFIKPFLSLNRRCFHKIYALNSPFNSLNNLGDLKTYVSQLNSSSSEDDIVLGIKAASKLERIYLEEGSETSKNEIQKLIKHCYNIPNILNSTLLKKTLCTHDNPTTVESAINAMEIFLQKTNLPISRYIAMGPLRQALYSADLKNAFKIVDLSAGHKRTHLQVRKKLFGYFICWGIFGASISALGQSFIYMDLLFGLNSLTFNLIWWTYYFNLSLFSIISTAGRFCRNGDIVKWINGVFYWHYFIHADEMKMVSRIVEVDRMLPENQGEISDSILNEIIDRNMVPVTSYDEKMMQMYWAESGRGFKWVEPDQDPAEIEWRQHMRDIKIHMIAGK